MNLGLTEMIFLFILGLLLFGPKKLPEIGRKLGKAMGEFKRASHEFQSQLNDEVRKLEVEEADSTFASAPPEGTTSRDAGMSNVMEPGSGNHAGETPEEDAVRLPETAEAAGTDVHPEHPERQDG